MRRLRSTMHRTVHAPTRADGTGVEWDGPTGGAPGQGIPSEPELASDPEGLLRDLGNSVKAHRHLTLTLTPTLTLALTVLTLTVKHEDFC